MQQMDSDLQRALRWQSIQKAAMTGVVVVAATALMRGENMLSGSVLQMGLLAGGALLLVDAFAPEVSPLYRAGWVAGRGFLGR